MCIAVRPLLGNLGVSLRQLQPSPRTVTHVAGGRMKLLGSLTRQVIAGANTTSECVYIAEEVQRLYLSFGACKALQLLQQDIPRPATQVNAVVSPKTPQTSTRPTTPPYELVGENVERLERWFLEQFGRTVFAENLTPLPEMPGSSHHIHLRPDARPMQNAYPPLFPTTSTTRCGTTSTTTSARA